MPAETVFESIISHRQGRVGPRDLFPANTLNNLKIDTQLFDTEDLSRLGHDLHTEFIPSASDYAQSDAAASDARDSGYRSLAYSDLSEAIGLQAEASFQGVQARMSPVAVAFAQIKPDDFRTCSLFLQQYPAILLDDDQQFLREAAQAYKSKRIAFARACTQRSLILRQWKRAPSEPLIRLYLQRLIDLETESYTEFYTEFEKAYESIKAKPKDGPTLTNLSKHHAQDGSSQSKLRESWSVLQSLATSDGRSQHQIFPLVGLEQVGSTWQTVLPETKSGTSSNGRHIARPASDISSKEAKSKTPNSETALDNEMRSEVPSRLAPRRRAPASDPEINDAMSNEEMITYDRRGQSQATTVVEPRRHVASEEASLETAISDGHGIRRSRAALSPSNDHTTARRELPETSTDRHRPPRLESIPEHDRSNKHAPRKAAGQDTSETRFTLPRLERHAPAFAQYRGSGISADLTYGDSGERESLDPRYQSQPSQFFTPGRVFAVLWHENAGRRSSSSAQSDPGSFIGGFNQAVYSTIRRMVVVKAAHGFSMCVPIVTYNGRGLLKPGLSKEDISSHVAIYMDNTELHIDPMEPKMSIPPIAIQPSRPDQKLHPYSRVNLNKVYSVEHSVKCMNVGRVARESLPQLINSWKLKITS